MVLVDGKRNAVHYRVHLLIGAASRDGYNLIEAALLAQVFDLDSLEHDRRIPDSACVRKISWYSVFMNDQEALRQAKSREFGEATQQAFEPAQGTFLGNAAQTARGGAIAGAWRPKLFEVLKDARGVTPEVEKCVADVMTYQPWDERQKLAGAMVVAALSSAIRTIIEHVPP